MKIVHDLESKRGRKNKDGSLETNLSILNFYIKIRENKFLEKELHNITTIILPNGKCKKKYYVKGIYTSDFLTPDDICTHNTQETEDIEKYIFYLEKRNKLIKRYLKILKY